jgi:hypothetical protein
MSVHVEWYDASMTSLAIYPTGSEIGEDEVTEEIALVVEGDSISVIEGSVDRIRTMLEKALQALPR